MPRRFIVVGAGGIGGWLVEGLVRMLEYKDPGSMLLIVDGDNFEDKNKERQPFTEFGNKAEVRAAELTPYFPQTFVVPVGKWVVEEALEVEDEEDAGQISASHLMNDGDVVYAVVDNFACRQLLFDTARQFDNIDVFTGGNGEGLDGSVYHYKRRDGQDLTDNPVDTHPELADPADRNPGQLSCQERAELEGGTQLIATNFMVAALLLLRTQHCIFWDNHPEATESFFDGGLGLVASYDRTADGVLVPSGGGE
jgi:molybdopterin/thiamine biosynthesis adenylyltransferase